MWLCRQHISVLKYEKHFDHSCFCFLASVWLYIYNAVLPCYEINGCCILLWNWDYREVYFCATDRKVRWNMKDTEIHGRKGTASGLLVWTVVYVAEWKICDVIKACLTWHMCVTGITKSVWANTCLCGKNIESFFFFLGRIGIINLA